MMFPDRALFLECVQECDAIEFTITAADECASASHARVGVASTPYYSDCVWRFSLVCKAVRRDMWSSGVEALRRLIHSPD